MGGLATPNIYVKPFYYIFFFFFLKESKIKYKRYSEWACAKKVAGFKGRIYGIVALLYVKSQKISHFSFVYKATVRGFRIPYKTQAMEDGSFKIAWSENIFPKISNSDLDPQTYVLAD